MPHLRTDAGQDLDLERNDDGTATITLYTDDVHTGAEPGPRFYSIPAVLTAAEARMVGAYLNPDPVAAPQPVEGAELRARARAARGTYDPTKALPADWRELVTYARAMSERGLEVDITVAADVPDLHDLDQATDGGAIGVTVRVDPDVPPPGIFTVGRNGQRIATYGLGSSAPR